MSPIHVLLTGATGFIGSHLAAALSSRPRYSVSILAREGSDVSAFAAAQRYQIWALDADAGNLPDILERSQPDVVVHLAALYLKSHTFQDIDPLLDSTVKLTTKLLEAMNGAQVKRFINTGTCMEYLYGDDYNPVNLYAAAKHATETMLTYYVEACSFSALTVKLYDTYGPRDPRPKLIPFFQKLAKASKPADFPPGEQAMDLVYIDDIVELYRKAVDWIVQQEEPGHELVWGGTGQLHSLREIAAQFEEIAGITLPIRWGAVPYAERQIMHPGGDVETARRLLNWKAKISLTEGLQRILKQDPL